MSVRFAQKNPPVGLLSPVDITETATASAAVALKNAQWLTFAVFFGTITGDSIDVTVEAMLAATTGATDTPIGGRYRLSGAVGSDSWGAVTTFDTLGVAIGAGDDDKILLIDIDPADVQGYLAAADYARVLLTPGSSSVTACEVAVLAFLEPRYPSASALSSS